jgi:hypothetical protein
MNALIEQAIIALNNDRKDKARHLLEQAVRADRRSELGWLLLSEVVDSHEEQRTCLVRALAVNRNNVLAQQRFKALVTEGGDATWATPYFSQGRALPWLSTQRADYQARRLGTTRVVPIALSYVFSLVVAEMLTTLFTPYVVGLTLYAVMLMAMFIHAALLWNRPIHRFLLSLALLPLLRLLSMSLPLQGMPIIYWYLLISLPLFVAAFASVKVLNLDRNQLGLTLRKPLVQLAVIFTGLAFGYIEYRIMKPLPLVTSLAWQEVWLPALILLVCTGFAEELIFRGIMQPVIAETLGAWAVLYTSFLFAMLHMGYRSITDVVFVFGVGLVFGVVREYTDSIVGISIAHGVTNIMLFMVMPLVMV